MARKTVMIWEYANLQEGSHAFLDHGVSAITFASKENVLGVIRSNGSIYVEDLDTKKHYRDNDWRCALWSVLLSIRKATCWPAVALTKNLCLGYRQEAAFGIDFGAKYVSSVAWSPDGKMVATGDSNGTVRLWTVLVENHLF